MPVDDLPTEYDDIVIGTGVQESIVAAALARIGHKVLHLDRNDYYSGEWASFHLKSMLDWIQRSQSEEGPSHESTEGEAAAEEGERLIPVPPSHRMVTNIQATVHVKDKPDPPPVPIATSANETGDQTHPTDAAPSSQHVAETQESDHQSGQAKTNSTNVAESPACGSKSTEASQEETGTTSNVNSSDITQSASSAEGVEHQSPDESSASAEQTSQSDVGNENSAASVVQDDQSSGQGHGVDVNPQNAGEGQAGSGQAAEILENGRKEWTWEEISKGWRKFNIDLAPKLMFCRGSMVELLVSSRISRYAEFKAVTRILTHINGKLEQVPCSRADVFSSRYVSVLEKRMLMKLIEFCLDHENREDEYRAFADKPFQEFLKSRKLTTTLQHFVIHSIAMVTVDTPTQQALKAMQYFLRSLGRYGNTAFLWTLYGSGELPQCFCRMCAVFGGIYMLRTNIRSMITDDENKIKGIIDSEGRRLTCRNLIIEYSYAPPQATPITPSYISRGILITDKSVKPMESEQITLVTIPPLEGSRQPVHLIEVGYAACAAPKDLYLVHLTCRASDQSVTARDDLQPVIDKFFQAANQDAPSTEVDDRPRVLWSLFFTQEDVTEIPDDALREGLPGNVHVTSGAGKSIGFDHAVAQAKRIFERVCPGEEFLPAAPDPDDLVYEDPAQDNPGHAQAGFQQEEKGDKAKDGTEEAGSGEESKAEATANQDTGISEVTQSHEASANQDAAISEGTNETPANQDAAISEGTNETPANQETGISEGTNEDGEAENEQTSSNQTDSCNKAGNATDETL